MSDLPQNASCLGSPIPAEFIGPALRPHGTPEIHIEIYIITAHVIRAGNFGQGGAARHPPWFRVVGRTIEHSLRA